MTRFSRNTPKTLWLGATTALALSLAPLTAVAADQGPVGGAVQETGRSFDIPAQPLSTALAAFGRQTGLQVTAAAADINGIAAPAVAGRMNPVEALNRLLSGSGLTFSFSDGGTVVVERPRQDGAIALPAVSVEGQVRAVENAYGPVGGYRATRTATGTKTDTDIKDVPQSVSVVSREAMEDRKANTLTEAVRNVAGVQPGSTYGNRTERLIMRGFRTEVTSVDGLVGNMSFGDQQFTDMANVERIEVLKGPSSVLYGLGNPGGLVNIVTKQPTATPVRAAKLSYGSFDFRRVEADAGGALTEDKAVQMRTVAAYQKTGSFRDLPKDGERAFVASSLGLVGEDTRVTFKAQYNDQEQTFDRGLIAVGDRVADVPYERYLGEAYSTYRADEAKASAHVEHDLGDHVLLRGSVQVMEGDSTRYSVDTRSLAANNQTVNRRVTQQMDNVQQVNMQADMTVRDLKTGPLDHTLLWGVDASRSERQVSLATATLAAINLYNPVYGARPGTMGVAARNKDQIDVVGSYLQDQIALGEQWKMTLGARFDHAETVALAGSTFNHAIDNAVSPRVGLIYQPVPELSLYTAYMESFKPQAGQSKSGNVFEPETGNQIEVGAKSDLIPDRLSATVAVYRLIRRNVETTDPSDSNFTLTTGEQRSQGVEVEVVGKISDGWQVVGAGTFTDATITKDTTFAVGNRLIGVPRFSGSLWSTYEFQEDALKGWRVGGGFYAASSRTGDLNNSFKAPGFVRFDAAVYYQVVDGVELSLNARNLLDTRYIETPASRTEIYAGEPFTLLGQIAVAF